MLRSPMPQGGTCDGPKGAELSGGSGLQHGGAAQPADGGIRRPVRGPHVVLATRPLRLMGLWQGRLCIPCLVPGCKLTEWFQASCLICSSGNHYNWAQHWGGRKDSRQTL